MRRKRQTPRRGCFGGGVPSPSTSQPMDKTSAAVLLLVSPPSKASRTRKTSRTPRCLERHGRRERPCCETGEPLFRDVSLLKEKRFPNLPEEKERKRRKSEKKNSTLSSHLTQNSQEGELFFPFPLLRSLCALIFPPMSEAPTTLVRGALDTAAKASSGGEEAALLEESPRSPLQVGDGGERLGENECTSTTTMRSDEPSASVSRGLPPPIFAQEASDHASGATAAGGKAPGGAEGRRASLTRTAIPSSRPSPSRRSSFLHYSSSPVVAAPPLSPSEAYYSYAGAAQEYYQQQPLYQQGQQGHYPTATTTMAPSSNALVAGDGDPSGFYYLNYGQASYSSSPSAWMGAYDAGAIPGGVGQAAAAGERGRRARRREREEKMRRGFFFLAFPIVAFFFVSLFFSYLLFALY